MAWNAGDAVRSRQGKTGGWTAQIGFPRGHGMTKRQPSVIVLQEAARPDFERVKAEECCSPRTGDVMIGNISDSPKM